MSKKRLVLAICKSLKKHILQDGRPLAYYSDRHGIFRVNIKEAQSGTGETQLSRALRELDIDLINANSPQAKGRVEKMNRTLQDRLVKELRIQGISSHLAEVPSALPCTQASHSPAQELP